MELAIIVMAIVFFWEFAVVGGTKLISGSKKNISSELMETIITQNKYLPIEEVMGLVKQEGISLNSKGLFQ